MANLSDLQPGLQLIGLLPGEIVTLIDVTRHGRSALEITYKRADGQPATQILYEADALPLTVRQPQTTWDFSAPGDAFRLAAEAYRIHLAHLFDPVLAVHTSLIEPLPHQITAVYGEMLTRQPLRFLLADDPGAGKTIMAGLLIKELIVRGDVRRCLICTPGSLAGQWQDELWLKFQLGFEVLTREMAETAVSGNPFQDKERLIIRLDQVSRSDNLKEKLARSDWDLIIVDEAHKMAASFWGSELKFTRRYRLGELLGRITRHFLLMTATPHNGKEADFQLFLGLLDPDRFENRSRSHTEPVDVSDLMRRMLKEKLCRFDGRPLFPERRAYTINFQLSPAEIELYEAVTSYVRDEFNRADSLQDDKRRGTVGFALTVLQRRLASSPEAIYQSLRRRRERLEKRLSEIGAQAAHAPVTQVTNLAYDFDWDDLDDAPAVEIEELEEQIMDAATAALTIAELQAEIATLQKLERMAYQVRQRGEDRKWEQVRTLLQENEYMVRSNGFSRPPDDFTRQPRRKLVIFTEHRDTLRYLHGRLKTLFGRDENIVHIDGGLGRDARRAVEERFRNDPDVHFLLATDAAGEGINLQRAHLMINYDLPWNPNRLEQRFGRIHRIGQTEVCHLWNLVAGETREGYVYRRLLQKLETEKKALNEQVFNVLGALFDETPLRQLLVEAIRYGDRPDVRARLELAIDGAVDQERVRQLIEKRSLAAQSMDLSQIERIRADMERYAARRLQPFYIKSFFLAAFTALGGALIEREPGRYRISHVPARIRDRAQALSTAVPVQRQYERICFAKEQITVPDKPPAAFICPGHPLLDAVIDLVREQHRAVLRQGTVLVDDTDSGDQPRMLFFIEQTIRDAAAHTVSQEVHFVEISASGDIRRGGHAPYLDYRPLPPDSAAWSAGSLPATELEQQARSHAIAHLLPTHLEAVRQRREALIDKTLAAVQERLTKEINYWDGRAAALRLQEKAGKPNARLNAELAQKRADELAGRLALRKEELARERQLTPAPPVIVGGALILPAGLLLEREQPARLLDTRITEAIAMQAVMAAEIALGCHPRDVSKENLGYDIESLDPRNGRLRFIEVKGRKAGADTVTVSKNEILTALNRPDQFILALVEVADGQAHPPRYVRQPFTTEPDFAATSVNYDLPDLLARSAPPE